MKQEMEKKGTSLTKKDLFKRAGFSRASKFTFSKTKVSDANSMLKHLSNSLLPSLSNNESAVALYGQIPNVNS